MALAPRALHGFSLSSAKSAVAAAQLCRCVHQLWNADGLYWSGDRASQSLRNELVKRLAVSFHAGMVGRVHFAGSVRRCGIFPLYIADPMANVAAALASTPRP